MSDQMNSNVTNSLNIQNTPVKKVHVGDIDIAYRTFGKGKPLLLIAGAGATMDMWDPAVLRQLSANPSGADIPFKVTMYGHGLPWTELNATQTYRVLGLYFTGEDSFLQIYGNQGAVTKAFPTNH